VSGGYLIGRKATHYGTCRRCGCQILPGDALKFVKGEFVHAWPCQPPEAKP
jgi:hypothetical protein